MVRVICGNGFIKLPANINSRTGLNKESDLIEDSSKEDVQENERRKEKERAERFKKGENK